MSNLVNHARRELEAAGLVGPEAVYDGMIAEAALALIEMFASQGHSGMSAAMCRSVFAKLAAFEPLCPLTGTDDEWNEVGEGLFQNNRCSRVFREHGEAYDIEGKVFREPDGGCYTSGASRVPIVFPYTPATVYVDVPATEEEKA